jgi:anti-sigma-K factor RskA
MSDQARDRSSVDDLLGAFALDAVEPEERELVEHHLAVDPDARAEVDAMRETAAVLASIPRDTHDAPDDLWDRISSAIHEPAAEPEPEPERSAVEPIPITRARRARSVPMRVFAPVVAAAAIVVLVLAVAIANRSPSRAGNLADAYRQAVAHGATTVALATQANGPVEAEIALQSDGTGYLRNEHLAALPAGRTYQLWAVTGSGGTQRVLSAGVLGPDPQAVAFHVASRPASFAITVEDAPGVVQSTQPATAVGEVGA